MAESPQRHLTRTLRLRHVYALSLGAMLSSGLFLLPGLAAEASGSSAVLAYLLAGIMAVPAMLSASELSTAMPRAGGVYYFSDRAFGPTVGTFAGLATWLSLVLKDAFALVGMSAYIALIVDVPGRPLAVALIAAFVVVNIVGSHTSASLQLGLVAFVLAILAWFLFAGLGEVTSRSSEDTYLDPFLSDGAGGFVAVIGLVFVSYGGLTKVASAAEEIDDPSRTIPLGMVLALATGTIIYTLGALVAIALVEPAVLYDDLAPIHTAAELVMPGAGAWLIVVAAIAAFASATNAGILAAARYPLAMSRDRLVGPRFGEISRFGTPAWGVLITGAGMAAVVIAFDAGAIAKLASAFVLVSLGLLNLSVIVMRSAHITSYAPGFRSPFYPYIQLFGVTVSIVLISQLGWPALLLLAASITVSLIWFALYARPRVNRVGAIRHVFERWGRSADPSLPRELSEVMATHGLRAADDYAGLIARAAVISLPRGGDIHEAAERASKVLSDRLSLPPETVTDRFLESGSLWIDPSESHSTATPISLFEGIEDDQLVIVRATPGIRIPGSWGGSGEWVNALFFLAGSADHVGRALRLAGELAQHLHENRGAAGRATTELEIKQALLPDFNVIQLTLLPEFDEDGLIGRRVDELDFDGGEVAAAVLRSGLTVRPDLDLVLEADDQLTIVAPAVE